MAGIAEKEPGWSSKERWGVALGGVALMIFCGGPVRFFGALMTTTAVGYTIWKGSQTK